MLRAAPLALLFLASLSLAAPWTPSAEKPAAETQLDLDLGFSGYFEARPSVVAANGEARFENTVELRYVPLRNIEVGYVQSFANSLNQIWGDEGYARVRFSDLWTNRRGDRRFSLENRLYLPTHILHRAAGHVASLRTHFVFAQDLGPRFTLTLEEVPIFLLYRASGSSSEAGLAANPFFENRVILTAEWNITPRLHLLLPLTFELTRHSPFDPGAAFHDRWAVALWIWPELDFDLTTTTTLGVAYYTENLLRDDFSGLLIDGPDGGFAQGVAQAVLRQSF